MERIYIYAENTTRKGTICHDDDMIESESDDIFLWGEGTEVVLVGHARLGLSERRDTRPGGAGDSFRHTCCRAVLDYFGASVVA